MLLIAVIALYEIMSMVWPLQIEKIWKVLLSTLLLTAAFKEVIFRYLGGKMFFAPLLPRWLILTGALMFNFFVLALFLAVLKDVIWLTWKFCRALGMTSRSFPAGEASLFAAAIALFLTLYGTWEAIRVPDVTVHDVYLPGLAKEFEGTKIVLLVDLHASALNRKPFIQSIVDKTNILSPDIILIPGDFVDGPVEERKNDLEPLSTLNAALGVFGSSGNHEYYSGYEEWKKQLSKYGVMILENEHVMLTSNDSNLVIAGIPDQQGANLKGNGTLSFEAPNVEKALQGAPNNAPVILMAHRPETVKKNAQAGIALQVSGHTHGGLMPFIGQLIAFFNGGYIRGWYNVGTTNLYVSRGTSLWSGFPMRLMDPAEITLFVLHSQEK
ncbi:MAG: metallophosphoesterase [Fretibacterium sp.]|nr:metallophosphoesterase [Fretibacterium sp.]